MDDKNLKKPDRLAYQQAKLELAGRKNVVMVKTGTKIRRGRDTGRLAIVVGVSKKEDLIALEAADIIPQQISGIETDVQEVGEFRALNMLAGSLLSALNALDIPDTRKMWRPAPGGVSIGNYRTTAGTLGCLVKRQGQLFILSNWHVLYGENGKDGDPIYQPGPYDGGEPKDTIADAAFHARLVLAGAIVTKRRCPFRKQKLPAPVFNEVDAALGKPVSDGLVASEVLEVGTISNEVVVPFAGLQVQKSGRTTHLSLGPVKDVDVAVKVNYGSSYGWFDHQFTVAALCQGGDSGSLVLTEDKKRVGLLFAGNDQVYIASPYSTLSKLLGLD
jgi:hypothetical protein